MTTSSEESLIKTETKPDVSPDATAGGLSELYALEAELGAGTKDPQSDERGSSVNAGGGKSAAGTPPVSSGKPRRKFKTYRPEQTVKMTIRQYWRFRDWMARRQLGLGAEYTGIFCGKDDQLVTPLVEPIVGCLDAYLPDDWIVFIEEKSPLLHLLLALFEVEQTFASMVDSVKKEQQQKTAQNPSDIPPSSKPIYPTLQETTGKAAK
jgi:hypothetical protein